MRTILIAFAVTALIRGFVQTSLLSTLWMFALISFTVGLFQEVVKTSIEIREEKRATVELISSIISETKKRKKIAETSDLER